MGKDVSKDGAANVFETRVSNLPKGLSQPALRALANAGIQRIEQLTGISEGEVKKLHGIGPNGLDQLRRALAANGLSFAAGNRKKGEIAMTESNQDTAVTFLKLASSGDVQDAYAKFVGAGFRHHNPYFEGSAETLMAGMEENARQNPDKAFDVKRVIAGGEYVVVHSHVRLKPGDPGIALVHIIRFDQGRIVELWDFGQPVLEESPNQYGLF